MPAMSREAAEAALHAQARAIVARDIGAAIRTMTPEGLARAMATGNTTWNVLSYEVAFHGADAGGFVFDLTLNTDLGPLVLRERFREEGGEWRMDDIERLSGPVGR
jgi:hypothetical protein